MTRTSPVVMRLMIAFMVALVLGCVAGAVISLRSGSTVEDAAFGTLAFVLGVGIGARDGRIRMHRAPVWVWALAAAVGGLVAKLPAHPYGGLFLALMAGSLFTDVVLAIVNFRSLTSDSPNAQPRT